MSEPFDEVTGVLRTYFDALYTCDLALFERVFHPRALYATADEPALLVRGMAEYFAVVAGREPPARRGETRYDRIDAIRFAGANTAFAEVRCAMAGRDFVDFLTLVRVEGAWRIIAKVFHFTPTATEA
jgi:hypothetical protein